jgi:hypothetical protein
MVIDDLNHIKMDLDQGCQADAQIEALQACCDAINDCIQKIGNGVSGSDQNAAYSGLGNEDPSSDGPSQQDLDTMAQI